MKKVIAAVAVVCVMCIAGSAIAQPNTRRVDPRNNQLRNMMNAPAPAPRDPRGQNAPGDFRGYCGNFRPGSHGDCWGNGDCWGFDGRGRGQMFAPDMPKEIREKAVELAKLKIDLEEAMTARPVNKAKALEVHAKMQSLENEIDAWRFAQRLERIEATQTQRDLNRNVPPARPAPAPAPAPETAPETPETKPEA